MKSETLGPYLANFDGLMPEGTGLIPVLPNSFLKCNYASYCAAESRTSSNGIATGDPYLLRRCCVKFYCAACHPRAPTTTLLCTPMLNSRCQTLVTFEGAQHAFVQHTFSQLAGDSPVHIPYLVAWNASTTYFYWGILNRTLSSLRLP